MRHTRGVLALSLVASAAQAFLIPSSVTLPDLVVKEDADTIAFEPSFHILDSERAEIEHVRQSFDDELDQARALLGDVVGAVQDEYRDFRSWSLLAYANAADPKIEMRLDCPDCGFLDAQGQLWSSRENTLNLDWEVSRDGKALLVNGEPVFPHHMIRGGIYARQQSGSELSSPRQLSFLTLLDTEALSDGSVHDLTFCVLGLDDDETVEFGSDGCMDVSLFDKDGSLHLVSVSFEAHDDVFSPDTISSTPWDTPTAAHDPCLDGTGLTAMMCRLRTAVVEKAEEWNLLQPLTSGRPFHHHRPEHHHKPDGHHRPCHGFKPHGDGIDVLRPEFEQLAVAPEADPLRFAHHAGGDFEQEKGEYYGRKAHHVLHMVASFARSFFFAFVAPIAIGIFAGLAASILGMLIGSLIGYLWIKLVHGGKRGNVTATQLAREARVDEEDALSEKELLDHAPAFTEGEAPPLYAEKE